MNFNRVISISITEKTSLPPEGIEEYKKRVIEELKKKYGPNALTNKTAIAEFEQKMEEYDKQWTKDDPSDGKFVTGKIKGARKKMFIDYGPGMDFRPTNKTKFVPESLYEGFPKDPEKLAIIFNDSRLGSYSRGAETQKGGVIAKVSLRATNDIKVEPNDCGTKMYLPTLVTKDNKESLLDRYMFDESGNTILITEDILNKYMGKIIKLRTPMYCNHEKNYCQYCLSKGFEGKQNAIALAVSSMTGKLVNLSMKKMHSSSISATNMDILSELS
jgi:hypothetical protein